MRYYFSINYREVLWAIKMAERIIRRTSSSSGFVHVLLQTIKKSPASAIHGTGVIFFQGNWPPEYLPITLNHEALHLLVYRTMIEDGKGPLTAAQISGKLVDGKACWSALSEVFDVDYKAFRKWLVDWVLSSTLPVRIIRGIRRRLF